MSDDRCPECDLKLADCRCVFALGVPGDQVVCIEWRSLKGPYRGLEDVRPPAEAIALRDRLNRLYEGKVHHFLTMMEAMP